MTDAAILSVRCPRSRLLRRASQRLARRGSKHEMKKLEAKRENPVRSLSRIPVEKNAEMGLVYGMIYARNISTVWYDIRTEYFDRRKIPFCSKMSRRNPKARRFRDV
jgi:hypothetical protein